MSFMRKLSVVMRQGRYCDGSHQESRSCGKGSIVLAAPLGGQTMWGRAGGPVVGKLRVHKLGTGKRNAHGARRVDG